jgi:hypothetical protein
MTGLDVAWSATGGEIDAHGRFAAGSAGDYQILAKVGSIEGMAQVRVATKNGAKDDEDPIIRPDPVITGFGWKGAVPPQKWMNFYTKVLSSLVSTPGLTLEVHVAVPAGDSASQAKIDATKAALRELGLSEQVEIRTE